MEKIKSLEKIRGLIVKADEFPEGFLTENRIEAEWINFEDFTDCLKGFRTRVCKRIATTKPEMFSSLAVEYLINIIEEEHKHFFGEIK